MEKVKISKEQGKAVAFYINGRLTKEQIIQKHVGMVRYSDDEGQILNKMKLDDLIVALYIGFEVYDPNDMIRELYIKHLNHDCGDCSNYCNGVASGIVETLQFLGKIEILKGVNSSIS